MFIFITWNKNFNRWQYTYESMPLKRASTWSFLKSPYSWHFFFTKLRFKNQSWRGGINRRDSDTLLAKWTTHWVLRCANTCASIFQLGSLQSWIAQSLQRIDRFNELSSISIASFCSCLLENVNCSIKFSVSLQFQWKHSSVLHMCVSQ